MTTLDRLFRKQILSRRKTAAAFFFDQTLNPLEQLPIAIADSFDNAATTG